MADLLEDPHVRERGDIVTVDDVVAGPMRQPAPYPRFDGRVTVPASAPRLGEHNEEIWCDELGFDRAQLAQLHQDGVV